MIRIEVGQMEVTFQKPREGEAAVKYIILLKKCVSFFW